MEFFSAASTVEKRPLGNGLKRRLVTEISMRFSFGCPACIRVALLAAGVLSFVEALVARPVDADQASPISLDATTIGGTAFGGTAGIIGVNEAAGIGNEQANVVSIRLHGVSDASLATAIAQSPGSTQHNGPVPRASVSIGPSAFTGASGLAQVNQAAGNANATVNTFSLRVGP